MANRQLLPLETITGGRKARCVKSTLYQDPSGLTPPLGLIWLIPEATHLGLPDFVQAQQGTMALGRAKK